MKIPKNFILLLFLIFQQFTFSQNKKELAKLFEKGYLNFNDSSEKYIGEFYYNEDTNSVSITKEIYFKKEMKTISQKYNFTLDNISYIEESISKSELENKIFYSYTLEINFTKPIYNYGLTKSIENEERSIDILKTLYLGTSQLFISENDVDILKKFTRMFFDGNIIKSKMN